MYGCFSVPFCFRPRKCASNLLSMSSCSSQHRTPRSNTKAKILQRVFQSTSFPNRHRWCSSSLRTLRNNFSPPRLFVRYHRTKRNSCFKVMRIFPLFFLKKKAGIVDPSLVSSSMKYFFFLSNISLYTRAQSLH